MLLLRIIILKVISMVKALTSDLVVISPSDRENTLNEETKAHYHMKPTLGFLGPHLKIH